MLTVDLNFQWSAPKAGFEWEPGDWVAEETHATASSLLVVLKARETAQSTYAPLQQETGLFRELAEVPPTQEGILAFANRYGNLGLVAYYAAAGSMHDEQEYGRFGEPLESWIQEIAAMKEAVELLDLVRRRDETALSRKLRWRAKPVEGTPPCWVYESSAGSVPVHGGTSPYTPADIFAPALGLLTRWVNERLWGNTTLSLASDRTEGKPLLEIKVGTLRIALWVQLAQAIVQPADYRRCKTCGRWFAVPDDLRKADQVFCQDACKSKDYRDRKAKAQEMMAEGKSAKVIAEEIQTDVATVKKWISKLG
jgi:hypothetical protein